MKKLKDLNCAFRCKVTHINKTIIINYNTSRATELTKGGHKQGRGYEVRGWRKEGRSGISYCKGAIGPQDHELEINKQSTTQVGTMIQCTYI